MSDKNSQQSIIDFRKDARARLQESRGGSEYMWQVFSNLYPTHIIEQKPISRPSKWRFPFEKEEIQARWDARKEKRALEALLVKGSVAKKGGRL